MTPMKVIRMKAPRPHILLALLVACVVPGGALRAERQTPVTAELLPAQGTPSDTEMDTQLRLNLTTLLENKNDKIRVDAATLLLFSENPMAREKVLDVLRRSDNPPARKAVCDALNPARLWEKTLKNKEDFIKPLLAILTSEEDAEIAKSAAEALLIFGYREVQADLEKAVTDASLPVNVRMNVIYAMRRHPDKAVVIELIGLLEGPDPQIADAARTALASLGISVGQDAAAQAAALAQVQRWRDDSFLRERLIRQEMRVRELETDLSAWQKRYLTALGKLHDSLTGDAAKTTFLAEQLGAPEVIVRSWALDKLLELRSAKGALKLSELEPYLLPLISDPSRQVRLKIARVLALIGELNTSKPLLERLKVEPDEQIKREILVALGEACYTGSVGTVGRKVPDDVRKETLEWAVKFLGEADADKARSGAGVLGKLLEQDGLKPEELNRYLKALSDRYVLASAGTDAALRGYLLGAMAGLCASRSTSRDQAVKLYGPLFDQALADKAPEVRLNAITGCVNVDKPGALRKLRENLAADTSVPIRQKLVELAGEVGGPQDLDWLAEKVGVVGEGDPAWAAMMKIFRDADLTVLSDWTIKIEALAAAGKLVIDQRIAFFTLVEQRAKRENRADVLKSVQTNLSQLYALNNNLKQAAEYLSALLETAGTEQEKQQIQAQLLRAYLGLASMDQACDLVSKCLAYKDLDLSPNGFVVRSIEEYLNSQTTADPRGLLQLLGQLKVADPETQRAWRTLVGRWSETYAKARKAEGSDKPVN